MELRTKIVGAWVLVVVLSPILLPIAAVCWAIDTVRERREEKIRRTEKACEMELLLRFKQNGIVEPIVVDELVFDVERSDEVRRFRERIAEKMKIEMQEKGRRIVRLPPELQTLWLELRAKFSNLTLPECVKVNVLFAGSGGEVHLELESKEIESDDTAEAFVERVLLRHVSDQLYLFWHAYYDHETIYRSRAQLSGVKTPTGVSRETQAKVDRFNFTPIVGKRADGSWACEYVVYHPYGDHAGVLRYRAIEAPNEPLGVYRAVVDRVSVPCSMCF